MLWEKLWTDMECPRCHEKIVQEHEGQLTCCMCGAKIGSSNHIQLPKSVAAIVHSLTHDCCTPNPSHRLHFLDYCASQEERFKKLVDEECIRMTNQDKNISCTIRWFKICHGVLPSKADVFRALVPSSDTMPDGVNYCMNMLHPSRGFFVTQTRLDESPMHLHYEKRVERETDGAVFVIRVEISWEK